MEHLGNKTDVLSEAQVIASRRQIVLAAAPPEAHGCVCTCAHVRVRVCVCACVCVMRDSM